MWSIGLCIFGLASLIVLAISITVPAILDGK
ncbi:hypothetical protein FHX44_115981 [Pseudonocardia hierapolitana]|uniref:Uncharacterized protein n=2 Tax=Pseudonocardia hierapolitana TaxID=1128676 RepID=A0A561SYW6_9PSEU|nr:hypothetical protein FHX44_115981 [Pseudonocardia hierapolitana]